MEDARPLGFRVLVETRLRKEQTSIIVFVFLQLRI